MAQAVEEKRELAFPGNGKQLLTSEQQRIRELEKKIKDVKLERDILKKSIGHFQPGTVKRYKAVHAHHSRFAVKKMCHVVSISESGYYKWVKKPESPRARENRELTERIKEFAEHDGKAGSPMIAADLKSEERFSHVGRNRVARIMMENNFRCWIVMKYKTTKDSRHSEPVAENLLDRNFSVSEPDKVWV